MILNLFDLYSMIKFLQQLLLFFINVLNKQFSMLLAVAIYSWKIFGYVLNHNQVNSWRTSLKSYFCYYYLSVFIVK